MKCILILITIATYTACLAQSEVERRVLNDGNLVLEDIPEIPSDVVDELNRYQNIRGAGLAFWAHDSESVFISTRFAELSQIHQVLFPGAARRQLTYFQEPYRGVELHPKNDTALIGRDVGGSEFYQIYLWDIQSGETRLLTDGNSRNSNFEWNRDGSKFAYTSTRRNGKANDIWVMDPKQPKEATLVLESSDGSHWASSDWSSDGRTLFGYRYLGNQDSRIFKLDTESGEIENLEGSENDPTINFFAGLNADESGYFFLTTQKSDFRQLAFRNFKTGKLSILTEKIPWDIDDFSLSHDRARAAFTANEDGMSVLYLLNPKTFAYEKVEGFPIGVVDSLEFSPDGSKLALSLTSSQSSSDVHVLDTGKKPLNYGKLEQWTFSEVGGLDTSTFATPELIRFKSFDGREIPAFVFKPEGTGPFPVVIDIHGGPESQRRPVFSSTLQMQVNKLGAAVIWPNVRGSAGYGKEYLNLDNAYLRENSVKDIGALLDWIATQDELDSERVAVTGGSYGGYMVLACAVHYSNRLAAAIDVVGISNFVTFLENTLDYRRDLRRVEYGDERDARMRSFLESISPNNYVDKIDVPMLIVQGQNDPRVPVTESEQMVQALRENDKTVWYLLGKNEGHGFRKKSNRDVYNQVKFMFLKRFLAAEEEN